MITAYVPGGLRSYDSLLSTSMVNGTTNAELTITLRVMLEKVPAGDIDDADGTKFEAGVWPAAAWAQYCRAFQSEGQAYWHGRYWLRTPEQFKDFDLSAAFRKYRPNVWCRFRLELVGTPAVAHKVIKVARLVKKPGSDPATFRSHEELYTHLDLGTAAYIQDGKVYRQRTFIHEIGHALDLPHIAEMTRAPACVNAGDGNADACYGTKHGERKDVMGIGMSRSTYCALPWVERIGLHTGTEAFLWKPYLARIYPQRVAA